MKSKNLFLQRRILKQLYFKGNLSCAEISFEINKSIPLTLKMLSKLLEEEYIVETGFAPSTGGRRPLMYSLKTDKIYVVSVALDQLIGRIAIMNMENRYVTTIEKFDLPLQNNPVALSFLIKKINDVINNSGIAKERIAGIGIGMPGFIDAKKGINYSFLETKDKSISDIVSNDISVPVFIDNDSSLIALAELRFGAARNKKNAMIINIGWGIGLGLILNGELFRGNNGFAGEFSHIPLFLNNKLCSCGKKGCLETETSLLVIAAKAKEGLSAGKVSILNKSSTNNLEEFTESILIAANNGDQFAIELLSEAGYNIGRGAAILIHILNPEIIILSGRGSSAGKIWEAPIHQALNEHCIPRLSFNTEIEISSLGYEAELIGAAALVMENYEKITMKRSYETESQFA